MTDPNPMNAGDPNPVDATNPDEPDEPQEGADAGTPTGIAEPDPEEE